MPNIQIIFEEPISASLQIGDMVYYSAMETPVPNSNIKKTTTSDIFKLGLVVSTTLNPPTVIVEYNSAPDASGNATVLPPPINSYIMFEKDKQVNSSSLIGYYADVKFLNDSKKKIELFSLGSEISESSK